VLDVKTTLVVVALATPAPDWPISIGIGMKEKHKTVRKKPEDSIITGFAQCLLNLSIFPSFSSGPAPVDGATYRAGVRALASGAGGL
jgi:hypothetical protein